MTVKLIELVERGVLEFGDGYRTRKDELGETGYRIVRAGDLHSGRAHFDGPDFVDVSKRKAIGRKLVQAGDVALTTKGTVGRAAVIPRAPEPAVYSPQICYFRVLDETVLDAQFLHCWLRSPEFWAQASYLMSATDMAPYLSLKDIGHLDVTLPDLVTQTAIADVLGALDHKIAANDREVGLLDELARSLTMRALAPGHSRVPLGDFAELTMGSSPKGETLSEVREGVPFHQGVRDFGVRQPTDRIFTSAPVRMAWAEDVLISVRAPVGSLNRTARELCIGRGLAAARSDSCSGATLFNLLRAAPDLWEAHGSDGTVFASITRSQLESMPLAVPEALSSLDERLRPLEGRLDVLVAESSRLASTRDALLPELMSGRLTVAEAASL